jgi:hypothetical protein
VEIKRTSESTQLFSHFFFCINFYKGKAGPEYTLHCYKFFVVAAAVGLGGLEFELWALCLQSTLEPYLQFLEPFAWADPEP